MGRSTPTCNSLCDQAGICLHNGCAVVNIYTVVLHNSHLGLWLDGWVQVQFIVFEEGFFHKARVLPM